MREHVTLIAWGHILWSGFHIAVALLLFLGFAGFGGVAALAGAVEALPLFGALGAFLFVIIGLIYVPGLLAGIGLLNRAPWARILAILLSVINLFHFPIGTILGGYSLVVLLSRDVADEFSRGY